MDKRNELNVGMELCNKWLEQHDVANFAKSCMDDIWARRMAECEGRNEQQRDAIVRVQCCETEEWTEREAHYRSASARAACIAKQIELIRAFLMGEGR